MNEETNYYGGEMKPKINEKETDRATTKINKDRK